MVEVESGMNGYSCPLCGDQSGEVLLQRSNVPVHQNVVCTTAEEARQCARGDLKIVFCDVCGFVFNAAFDPRCLSYSSFYDNTQALSPYFQQYLIELSNTLLAKHDLRGKQIIEVGCGKGNFLRLLCKGGRNHGLGFDPSYVGPETEENEAVRFMQEFYRVDQVPAAPDFVCCRHVLEHVQDPLRMLRAIRQAFRDRTDSVVYFELPNLTWILETVAFWDFFYEHCSYFTAGGLARAFELAAFQVMHTCSAFGGQYLCLEARPLCHEPVKTTPPPGGVADLRRKIRAFQKASEEKIEACADQVMKFHRAGGCAIWGAAAKGVTFANIVDAEKTYIRYVVDINPAKQGKFVPGTGHPIIAPEDLAGGATEVAGLLSMNPNYLDEQCATLERLSLAIPILSI
jgi:2-polyprenyl-3-methyl-5-hydroxy-6-metoxy-1,4-benzoquinol methylase